VDFAVGVETSRNLSDLQIAFSNHFQALCPLGLAYLSHTNEYSFRKDDGVSQAVDERIRESTIRFFTRRISQGADRTNRVKPDGCGNVLRLLCLEHLRF